MAYPVGDVFRPLLADPRQPRFFVSLREVDMPAERMTTVAVGFGETFGLYRFAGSAADNGVQIGLEGGLFALSSMWCGKLVLNITGHGDCGAVHDWLPRWT